MSITDVNERFPVGIIHIVEDDTYYIDLAKQTFAIHGLKHTKDFTSLHEYREYLAVNPHVPIGVALLDYRFPTGDLTGMDIAKQLYERSKKKKIKTKTIMITGYDVPKKEERKFFNKYHGYAWLDKHDDNFEQDYKDLLQEAAQELIEAYEDLVFLTELKDESEVIETVKSTK